jgi:hypothetical protein
VTRIYRVHLGIEFCGSMVRMACGYCVPEKNGVHAWVDGKSRFHAMEFEDVNCKRCLAARENYLRRRVFYRFGDSQPQRT